MAGLAAESYILRSMPLATTVLVVRFGSLGDVILTTGIIRQLCQQTKSPIDVVTDGMAVRVVEEGGS